MRFDSLFLIRKVSGILISHKREKEWEREWNRHPTNDEQSTVVRHSSSTTWTSNLLQIIPRLFVVRQPLCCRQHGNIILAPAGIDVDVTVNIALGFPLLKKPQRGKTCVITHQCPGPWADTLVEGRLVYYIFIIHEAIWKSKLCSSQIGQPWVQDHKPCLMGKTEFRGGLFGDSKQSFQMAMTISYHQESNLTLLVLHKPSRSIMKVLISSLIHTLYSFLAITTVPWPAH